MPINVPMPLLTTIERRFSTRARQWTDTRLITARSPSFSNTRPRAISAKPNRPISTATKLRPPYSDGNPNVKRAAPEIGSRPMNDSDSPISPASQPFRGGASEMEPLIITPQRPSRNISQAPHAHRDLDDVRHEQDQHERPDDVAQRRCHDRRSERPPAFAAPEQRIAFHGGASGGGRPRNIDADRRDRTAVDASHIDREQERDGVVQSAGRRRSRPAAPSPSWSTAPAWLPR